MKKITSDPNLKRLYSYLWPFKWRLCIAVIFLLGAASMSSLTATLLGQLTDHGFYNADSMSILIAPLTLVGVALFYAVCTVMNTFIMSKITHSILLKIRTELFERILHWPSSRFMSENSGRVASKFVNEATVALGGAIQSVVILVRDSAQVIALISILFWHNWQLTFVSLTVMPILALVLRIINNRVKKVVNESQENVGRMIMRVQEAYGLERLVKITKAYDFEEERFNQSNSQMKNLALKQIKYQSLGMPATHTITMLAVAIVVGFALFQAQQGTLTMGEFITFLSAMILLRTPIQKLAGLNATFASMSVAAKSIFETLDTAPEEDKGTVELKQALGEIEFKGVSFRYPETQKDSLRNLSFKVAAQEHIALVGGSGAGKSSIVNLLTRFWHCTEGEILVDGTNIQDYTLASLRSQISMVTQDVSLFDDTIRANLIYGLKEVSEEAIEKALKAASLDTFVAGLPKGLETVVGEGGSLLSGGQKQRVSIARAFLRDAPILILDEATSALDAETEEVIKASIETLTKGRTVIMIAHRYSSIEGVDRILVLEDGELREEGTMPQLLSKPSGIFKHLWMTQQGKNAS